MPARRCPRLLILIWWVMASAQVALAADEWFTVRGTEGPGVGRTIVLISGDEEYRSEESLPQLARILATHHGFTCHVLFAIDPATGEINPDHRSNIPGLALLADADLMVIATRFRSLPDAQMAHIDRYVQSGRPIVGLRTATHAFAPDGETAYPHYGWNHDGETWPQGFGRAILGETWIAHHGRHGVQGTRGVIDPDAREHPIARGLAPGSIFGDTDVYRVRLPLPDGCTTIVRGAVTETLEPSSAIVEGALNDPMMPLVWTRDPGPHGGRVVTSTLGAATDFIAAGSRRLIVNAAYWAIGLEAAIPETGASVDLVGPYDPTAFGFETFVRGRRPSDVAALPAAPPAAQEDDSLPDGPVVLLAGNTVAERLAQSGLFELVVHAAEPNARVVQVPWSGDEVTERPRETNVPTLESWIERENPTTIVFSTGASEAYDAAARETYEADLRALVDTWRARANQPEVVLVTPMRVEPTESTARALQHAAAHREHIDFIVRAIHAVAEATGARVVDANAATSGRQSHALTTNGIHPNTRGCVAILEALIETMEWDNAPATVALDEVRERIAHPWRQSCDRHFLERLRYRPTNTEYVWGRRHEPFGVVNFPAENAQLDRMIAARGDRLRAADLPSPVAILAAARDQESPWPVTPSAERWPEDDWTPEPVEARGTETSLGALEIDAPDAALETFTLAPDYVIECFASEQDFPELANPLAMAFDDRHRLWVLCTPTYPHLLPGSRGTCRLIVLEDTDRDGRADTCSTFADELVIPTGFALDVDTVYLGAAPDLLRLRDTDGDGRADETTIVASGFGMCDSHHQISAFEWDPTGTFLMHEGVFTRSSLETPTGTIRTRDSAVWRVDPRTGDLTLASHASFSNPWGHVFDSYGASILADASGGNNHVFSYVAVGHPADAKPRIPGALLNRGRPTAGCEILAGRHFPESVHGTFVVNQSIGFHGTRWDRLIDEGSSWRTERMDHDLVSSRDTNFRPVAMELGPDGALYIVDWCNPIIGHMQYSVRDPRRDHTHGRVWRVRHAERPLVTPPTIDGASIDAWLELLRLPEPNTRQLVRRRLQRASWSAVAPRLNQWLAALRADDPESDRLHLEALWIRLAHGTERVRDWERVLSADEPRVRAGGVRAMRQRLRSQRLEDSAALPWLLAAAEDVDMRVRLEATVAASVLAPEATVQVLSRVESAPMDSAMQVVFESTMDHVTAQLSASGGDGSELVARSRIERLDSAALAAESLDVLTASVVVRRADQTRTHREAALTVLAGGDDQLERGRAALAAAHAARRVDEAAVISELLFALPADVLDRLADDHRVTQNAGRAGAALIAHAFRVRAGDDLDLTPAQRLAGAEVIPAADIPEEVQERLAADIVAGRLPARDGMLTLQRGGAVGNTAWLDAQIEAVANVPSSGWSSAHARAMDARRIVSELDRHATSAWRLPLAPAEQLARGAALYHDEALGCARCHGASGEGMEGFPPLSASPWVVGDNGARAAAIVIHGLSGPLSWHDGRQYNAAMEPLGALLDDQQIADVLTYVRQRMGNFAEAVSPATVAAVRADPDADGPWAVTRLLERYPVNDEVIVARVGVIDHRAAESSGAGWLSWVLTHLALPLVAVGLIVWRLERLPA